MAEHIDADEMKLTLQRVATYRQVCRAVRKTADRSLTHGVAFLLITGLLYNNLRAVNPFLIAYGCIGVLEVLVGIWKKLRPNPECVLFDAVLEAAFGLSVLGRHAALMAANNFKFGQDTILFTFIGLWSLYTAVHSVLEYLALRRLFVERPTAAHLAYFNSLVAEIRQSDPTTDVTALDLPTKPHLKAKLLGDIVFLVETKSGRVTIVGRDEFEIERQEGKGEQPATGFLSVGPGDQPGFVLDPATWRNYTAWKAAGGHS